ncbi:cobalt ABC transporter permease [Candidatus Epulonipiscioides gigas]|nr:cobalt ABC transporter permease [Epulopiscium sp. SCG-C07WGA-EpuloA2]
MQSISLYENKNSFLNGLSPATKALYILTAILIPIILDYNLLKIDFIVISIILLITSKTFKKTYPMIFISGFLLLTIAIVQGLFNPNNITPILTIGAVVFYKEGLLSAFEITLNILNLIFSISILILTTKPSYIADALVAKGLSPRLGYIFVSLFLLVPQITQKLSIITDAQWSRGMETEGNLFVRIKAFIPLISPVIMSSFMDVKERSIALEVRGFNSTSKKTFLNEFIPNRANKWVFILLIVLIIISIILRGVLWLL